MPIGLKIVLILINGVSRPVMFSKLAAYASIATPTMFGQWS